MSLTREQMIDWCTRLLSHDPEFPALEACLQAIPGLKDLSEVAGGTRVLIRCDLDVAVKDGQVVDDTRLRSLLPTLGFALERGWIPIVYGHIGRDPELTLKPVAQALDTLLREAGHAPGRVHFIPEWMNDETGEILPQAGEVAAGASPGDLVVLENTRRYSLERVLWKARVDDLPALAEKLACYANGMREQLATVHVNEGFAASNLDLSSTVVPCAMDRVALGEYIAHEFGEHVVQTRAAELVVFSGLKIDKLDALEQILSRGQVRMVIAAGNIALSLCKADAALNGRDFELGRAAQKDQKTYIPPERIEQATRMLQQGRERGIEFVLPVDFVLEDGSVAEAIPPDGAQMDVGPETDALFARSVSRFLDYHREKLESGKGPAVAFHNGVFGKFEEERFACGTRRFLAQLKRMHDAGVKVYVGGGEGGAALRRFADESWVTHCFTAGGTILKALGTEPIPYLKALYLRVQQER